MTITIIKNKKTNAPLSYFHSNGNGTVKDIVGCSKKNYIYFEGKAEASLFLHSIRCDIMDMQISDSLHNDLLKYIDNLVIEQVLTINK